VAYPWVGSLMADWDFNLGGVAFGGSTNLDVVSVNGWLNLPDVRSADALRAGGHGMYAGRDLAGGRVIAFDLEVIEATPAATAALLAALEAQLVVRPAEIVLTGELPGRGTWRTLVRPRRRNAPLAYRSVLGHQQVLFEVVASDPRLYSNTLSSVVGTLGTSSGGLTFAASAPFVFGSAGGGGFLDCTNAGTFETPYRVTFTGPLVAPSIEHTGQGRKLEFTGTLAAGETLIVDSLPRTVLLGGTASRYGWLTSLSQWFTLDPGPNNLRFTAASGTGTCQVDYRSAWM
jgi:hypothetical protein